MGYKPENHYVGGFTPNDATIDFYLRIKSLLEPEFIVLDLGAGRASWYHDDKCKIRRDIRKIHGTVKKMIAVDLDSIVLENPVSDIQIHMKNNNIGVLDNSIDLIICDFVLEHVDKPSDFISEIERVLKPGGYFCARTPPKSSYAAIISRSINEKYHESILNLAQPKRKNIDVFDAYYLMNDKKSINRLFSGWNILFQYYKTDPAYFGKSKILYKLMEILHKLLPPKYVGNIFLFCQKKN